MAAPRSARASMVLSHVDSDCRWRSTPLTGLRASELDPSDDGLSARTRTCLREHLAAGVEVSLAEDERPTTPLHVTLIVPFIVGTTGDVYADPIAPSPAAP